MDDSGKQLLDAEVLSAKNGAFAEIGKMTGCGRKTNQKCIKNVAFHELKNYYINSNPTWLVNYNVCMLMEIFTSVW